jgi:hypothetical protein
MTVQTVIYGVYTIMVNLDTWDKNQPALLVHTYSHAAGYILHPPNNNNPCLFVCTTNGHIHASLAFCMSARMLAASKA